MIYIYDILLNWTDTDQIYEFFEWNSSDMIEHIKKIPLVKVSTQVMSDLLNHTIEIDEKTRLEIHNKSEAFAQKKSETIAYAALFTDEKRAVAIEFDEEGRGLYRSYLLLDEEEEILEIAERLNEKEVSYRILSKNKKNPFCTRKEEMMKRYLIRELKNAYQNKNKQKLHYLYTEYFDEENAEFETMYRALFDSCKNEFNEKHHRIYQLLKLSHTKKQV